MVSPLIRLATILPLATYHCPQNMGIVLPPHQVPPILQCWNLIQRAPGSELVKPRALLEFGELR